MNKSELLKTVKDADGSGSEEQLLDYGGALVNPWDWSRDGKYILVRKGTELGYLTWPDRVPTPWMQTKWTIRGAQFSPDGRWIAYSSNETGNPVPLFQTNRRQPLSSQDLFSYDVTSDGQKFLIATKLDEPNSAPLSILLNWASEPAK